MIGGYILLFEREDKGDNIRIGHIEIKPDKKNRCIYFSTECKCHGGIALTKEYLEMLIKSLQKMYNNI